ncbi:MAG: hypothetical protein EON90_08735 [Brevundimonas sp.]|nr:MAG: hypothetical protein EON90_08735 [Brevundimonas sp.]
MMTRLLSLAVAMAVAACGPSDTPTTPAAPAVRPEVAPTAPTPDPALKAFLEAEYADAGGPIEYVAKTHGEGLDQITVVYLSGRELCGSGGCRLMILGRQGDPYAILGRVTITRPPIRVLSTSTNGRPDIGVRVSGGGIMEPYEAALPFNGTRYASNPSVLPARRVDNAQGETLITDDDPRVTLKE